MFYTPKEIVDNYRKVSVDKAHLPAWKLLGKSFLAGWMIAMGAAGSSVAAHAITNVGLARLVAAVVFPVGLMMVILLGAELFTGDCLMAVALPRKEIKGLEFARTLTGVFLGNFVGAIVMVALVYFSGQFDYSGGLLGAYTIKVAYGKVMLSPLKGITSGICCNILVSAAVLMAMAAKDVTGKLWCSFFVIMLFVTSGYEHCVANMYYITAGLFAKCTPQYVAVAMEQYGLTATQLEQLNVGRFLLCNLVPVTIGNIIGGSLFVGLSLYYLNCRAKEV